jgi:hypothetical protein
LPLELQQQQVLRQGLRLQEPWFLLWRLSGVPESLRAAQTSWVIRAT